MLKLISSAHDVIQPSFAIITPKRVIEKCSLFDCNGNTKDNFTKMQFRFPKDKITQKKWINFCGREDKFNVNYGRI